MDIYQIIKCIHQLKPLIFFYSLLSTLLMLSGIWWKSASCVGLSVDDAREISASVFSLKYYIVKDVDVFIH